MIESRPALVGLDGDSGNVVVGDGGAVLARRGARMSSPDLDGE